MADQEFEEFIKHLDLLPQHIKAPAQTYKLVHGLTPMEETKSFLEKVQIGGKLCGLDNGDNFFGPFFGSDRTNQQRSSTAFTPDFPNHKVSSKSSNGKDGDESSDSDDDLVVVRGRGGGGGGAGDGAIRWTDKPSAKKNFRRPKLLPSFTSNNLRPVNEEDCPQLTKRWMTMDKRKETKNQPKAPTMSASTTVVSAAPSLMEELFEAERRDSVTDSGTSVGNLTLNFDKSDDLAVDGGAGDVDSGNSTNHSPDENQKQFLTTSCISNATTVATTTTDEFPRSPSMLSSTKLELLEPTHRGLHRFVPRHPDEIEIDIGDPVYVQKEAEDLWCEGANLRTGVQGIFPIAHVVDVDYNDFVDPNGFGGSGSDDRKERYLLDYLGSVESSLYKGNIVLCQAVRKILQSSSPPRPHSTILEISDKGIKMIDKNKAKVSSSPCHDYFYSLKNVTFCGFHPFDSKFFGFVTKHPRLPKYACHVFVGERSTQPVAEACGRAFQRFYQKFIDTAFPVEDIYLE